MQGKLITAALALVLVCSLAGCRGSTAARFDPVDYDNSTPSVIDRNGVYNGTDALNRNGQSGLLRDTPNWNELFDNVDNNTVNRNAAATAQNNTLNRNPLGTVNNNTLNRNPVGTVDNNTITRSAVS